MPSETCGAQSVLCLFQCLVAAGISVATSLLSLSPHGLIIFGGSDSPSLSYKMLLRALGVHPGHSSTASPSQYP